MRERVPVPAVITLHVSNDSYDDIILLSWVRLLWLSPIATGGHPHPSTDFPGLHFPIHPVPGLITCTGVPHLLLYLSSLHTHTHCEVLFCPGWHSERYSCILWSSRVWPWTVDSLLPALVILLLEIPIVLLPALTPARYCLRLCLASDIPDTVVWSLPVWPCLSLLKWDCKWIHTPQTLRYNYKW